MKLENNMTSEVLKFTNNKRRYNHKEDKIWRRPTGSYQRLDLFLKVLRVLCPNLTDVSLFYVSIVC